MRLQDYSAALTTDGIDLCDPDVAYREIHGHPVPYQTTIQRDGTTVTVGEVQDQMALDGPVAYWIRYHTLIDVEALMRRNDCAEPAYLRELSSPEQAARGMSLRAIDVGFDLRVQQMAVTVPLSVTTVAYDGRDGTAQIVRGDRDDILHAMRRAGYRISAYRIS